MRVVVDCLTSNLEIPQNSAGRKIAGPTAAPCLFLSLSRYLGLYLPTV